MKIKDIIPNPNNPRIIKDDKFAKLVQSIKEFPEMLELRPIVIDEDNMVLGGNMRLKACIEAGLTDVPVKVATLTEEQKKEFIIKDNVGFGEWEWDTLANEWEVEQLQEWGLDIPVNFKTEESDDISENMETNFRIEVILTDEKSQELLYNELIERSYECRLLTL
jgi:ParB-like chromosome segregation protein Spo0J